MFEAEAGGLEKMWETQTIRVPKPLKVGPLPGGGSYIVMEFIEFGSRSSQADLGRALGEMHKASLGQSPHGFGFFMDNTIGSTHQPNTWTADWVAFFREHRLGFQLDLARRQYSENALYDKGQKLLEKLPELLGGVEVEPVLLHGDLWSGNVASDKQGRPVILDPACYYGHSEAEFGMSWCAGFNSSFYDAYHKVIPKQPGFERRVEIYKLYHYLNHLNLFGSGYRGSCTAIIDKYV
jgi:fructosamine-3-kinase